MTTVWARIETDLGEAVTWLEAFFKQTVEAEITALAPIAEAAVATIVQDAGSLTSPTAWVAAVSGVALTMFPQLEATGLKVAGASVLTAIGGALANAQAKAGAATTAPVPTTPAT